MLWWRVVTIITRIVKKLIILRSIIKIIKVRWSWIKPGVCLKNFEGKIKNLIIETAPLFAAA